MLSEDSSVKGSPEDKQPLALVSREVPRFHGGSLWHSTPALQLELMSLMNIVYIFDVSILIVFKKFHCITIKFIKMRDLDVYFLL